MNACIRHALRLGLLLGLATCSGKSALAAVVFTETFSYPDGRLASAPPTGGVSGGLWTASHPSGFMAVYVSDGSVTLHHYTHPHQAAPLPESVSRGFAPLAAGQTVYAGLDVSASGNNVGHYFAALGTNLYITPTSGGDFTLGIGNGFSNPTVSWDSPLAFNTTYRVVMSYEFDTGSSKLWVDPASESSTNVVFANTATRPLSAFVLRQTWMSEDEPASAQVLDNLVVGTTFDDVLTVGGPALPGDINLDRRVDGLDAALFTPHLGTTSGAVWGTGDFDNDGATTLGDLAILQSHLGAVAPSPIAVPEPAGLAIALLAVALASRFRRR